MLRAENFLNGRCMNRISLRTGRKASWQSQTKIHQRPIYPIDLRGDASLTGAAFRGCGLLFAMWRDPHGDGKMRPGDWLVLLTGSALIIVLALALL